MKPKELDREFSVCKVEDYSLVDLSAEYSFIGKTAVKWAFLGTALNIITLVVYYTLF